MSEERTKLPWMEFDQDTIDNLLSPKGWQDYKSGMCLCAAHSDDECVCGAWRQEKRTEQASGGERGLWRSMESVPKDGTVVIVRFEWENRKATLPATWQDDDRFKFEVMDHFNKGLCAVNSSLAECAVAWRPLPEYGNTRAEQDAKSRCKENPACEYWVVGECTVPDICPLDAKDAEIERLSEEVYNLSQSQDELQDELDAQSLARIGAEYTINLMRNALGLPQDKPNGPELIGKLEAIKAEADALMDALIAAKRLIIEHHNVSKPVELGQMCPHCCKEDGSEPVLDQIAKALQSED